MVKEIFPVFTKLRSALELHSHSTPMLSLISAQIMYRYVFTITSIFSSWKCSNHSARKPY